MEPARKSSSSSSAGGARKSSSSSAGGARKSLSSSAGGARKSASSSAGPRKSPASSASTETAYSPESPDTFGGVASTGKSDSPSDSRSEPHIEPPSTVSPAGSSPSQDSQLSPARVRGDFGDNKKRTSSSRPSRSPSPVRSPAPRSLSLARSRAPSIACSTDFDLTHSRSASPVNLRLEDAPDPVIESPQTAGPPITLKARNPLYVHTYPGKLYYLCPSFFHRDAAQAQPVRAFSPPSPSLRKRGIPSARRITQ